MCLIVNILIYKKRGVGYDSPPCTMFIYISCKKAKTDKTHKTNS